MLVPVRAQDAELISVSDGYAMAAHLGVGWPTTGFPTRQSRRLVENFTTIDTFLGARPTSSP